MGGKFQNLKHLLSQVINTLITVYLVYIAFLYLWSTFEYITPKGAFILALIITFLGIGAFFWFQQKGFKKG